MKTMKRNNRSKACTYKGHTYGHQQMLRLIRALQEANWHVTLDFHARAHGACHHAHLQSILLGKTYTGHAVASPWEALRLAVQSMPEELR